MPRSWSILLHICNGCRPSGHQAGGNHRIYAAEWRSLAFTKKCSSILLHICNGCLPSGHQAGGNHCIYAAEWKSPVFTKKCSSILLHICSRMVVAPFRTFFDMLKVCNYMPKQLLVSGDPCALSSESHVFDDFMCFDMCVTILS